MTEPTEQEPEVEPDLTPRESRILAEAATVEACQADYDAAADIRDAIARRERRNR